MSGAAGRPSCCPAKVLNRVKAMRASGATLKEVCAVLNAAGIPTPGGGVRWYPSHISRLLRTRTAGLDEQELQQMDRRRSTSGSLQLSPRSSWQEWQAVRAELVSEYEAACQRVS